MSKPYVLVLKWIYYLFAFINFLILSQADSPNGVVKVDDYSPKAILWFLREQQANKLKPRLRLLQLLESFSLLMLQWQSKNISLKDLWQLPEKRFLAMQGDLVDFLEWVINDGREPLKTIHGQELRQKYKENWVHGKAWVVWDFWHAEFWEPGPRQYQLGLYALGVLFST